MTYAVRAIDLTIQLGQGSFGGGGFDTVTLSGLRINALLSNVMMPGATTAVLQVYGLTLSQINQLTKAGLQYSARFNKIAVSAGDATSGMTAVFQGIIIEAYPDFTTMPESAFVISATTTGDLQLKPITPASVKGAADVGSVMGQMAGAAGLGFENNLTTPIKLSNPYFSGTIIQQINSCARAANIYAYVDGVSNTLVIMPKGGSRSGGIPIISPQTGMIGYPQFQQVGVVVRTLFDPNIKFGGQVQIQSQLTAASGSWNIYHIDYALSSVLPGGPWEMTLTGYSPNAAA